MRLRNEQGDYMDLKDYPCDGCAEITIDLNDYAQTQISFTLDKNDLQDLINWAQLQTSIINRNSPS